MKRLLATLAILLIGVSSAYAQNEPHEPLPFPLSASDEAQIEAARNCHIDVIAANRYPKEFTEVAELADVYTPETPCDWAALAYASILRMKQGERAPDEANYAFIRAVRENPALALRLPLLQAFFGWIHFVEAPFAGREITHVAVRYDHAGMGGSMRFDFEIDASAGRVPRARGLLETEGELFEPETEDDPPLGESRIRGTLELEQISALQTGLTELVPISEQFSLTICYDNYPDWSVALTFDDGTVITLNTNGSNEFTMGGPWQVEIDGQNYIQYSVDFGEALVDIIDTLELPLGRTMAMTCGNNDDPFDLAFPPQAHDE